jgi:hypothetical protein
MVAPPGTIAQHDWFWAGYVDACGYPERALQTALRAGATAAQDGSESYIVLRIYAFAARLAADLASTHEDGSVGRPAYLDMVARCVRAARRSLALNDLAGKGFIHMRQARLDSLRHRTARALERIAAAERQAHELDDGPLLVQALTVHGQIVADRREDWEAALHLYRQAQAIAVERGIPYASLPARRALRRLEELLPREER